MSKADDWQKTLPDDVVVYLTQLVNRLQQHLQPQLVGVYLFGSAAYGDYQPGVSDLDVQAVVTHPLSIAERQTIAELLFHTALPCPARQLEFVCYHQRAVNPANRHSQFEINLNTRAHRDNHLTFDLTEESSYWFVLDIAIGYELGYRLCGAELTATFAPIPRIWQLEAILDSLTWHSRNEGASINSILNACRGWRYAVTGNWGSKRTGGLWASEQPEYPAVVVQVLTHQQGTPSFNQQEVALFIEMVTETVHTAVQGEHAP
ncbi:MAG: aminoglycoside adenylyltransferase domain-containing protein [Chloroflexota bacterium]